MDEAIYRIAVSMPGFLLAIVAHEWAHGYVALKFGDPTAKNSGRLSFNPMVHLHPFGTIVFPILGAIMGGTMFGWANPVPVDPRYFKRIRLGIFWVSFAGPGMNIILGSLSALLAALVATKISSDFYFYKPFTQMLVQSVVINFVLAAFNLIPFPPLDGSKMVSSLLSYENMRKYESLQNYGIIFLFILLFTNLTSYIVTPAVVFGQYLLYYFTTIFSS